MSPSAEQIALQVPSGPATYARADHRTDPVVELICDTVADALASLDVAVDRAHVAAVCEAAEALPRALALRGRHLDRCSIAQIVDVTVMLAQANQPGRGEAHNFAMNATLAAVVYLLYPQVSPYGHNVGFASFDSYRAALAGRVSDDHADRLTRLQLPRVRSLSELCRHHDVVAA